MTIDKTIFTVALLLFTSATHCTPNRSGIAPVTAENVSTSGISETAKLEREKFEYQKAIEEKKLEVEQLKAWLTGGSGLKIALWQTAWGHSTAAADSNRCCTADIDR